MSVEREFAFRYGAIEIGGPNEPTTGFKLDGYWTGRKGFVDAEIGCYCVVVGDTEAVFASRCAALEAAFRTPYQNASVTQGGAIAVSASPSINTGLDTMPEIEKAGDDADTGRSRRYRCIVRYQLPADKSPTSGLRESRADVSLSASGRATVRLSGIVTAVGSSSARSRYDSFIDSYAASVMSSLGVTVYELVGQPAAAQNLTDKTLEFQREYREIIFGQAQDAVANDSELAEQVLRISVRHLGSEYSQGYPFSGSTAATGSTVRPLSVVEVDYVADVIKGKDPLEKYDSIRSWLLRQLAETFDKSQLALMEESPEADQDNNRLRVRMRGLLSTGDATILQRTYTVRDEIRMPKVFDPAWTGDPLSHYVYDGNQVVLRHFEETYTRLGLHTTSSAAAALESAAAGHTAPPHGVSSGGRWTTIMIDPSATPRVLGLDGKLINVTDLVVRVVRRYTKDIKSRSTTPDSGPNASSRTAPSRGFSPGIVQVVRPRG